MLISCITYEGVVSPMNESCHVCMSHVTYEWVMSHIWRSRVSDEWVMWRMNESRHRWMSRIAYEWVTYEWVISRMGWLWLVGSIKLPVSFAKEPYKRDDILQKRPIILSILLTVATPYEWLASYLFSIWRLGGLRCVNWMSRVTRVDESCHTDKWVMSQRWRSCVTYEWTNIITCGPYVPK